jgi:hypothetical protein
VLPEVDVLETPELPAPEVDALDPPDPPDPPAPEVLVTSDPPPPEVDGFVTSDPPVPEADMLERAEPPPLALDRLEAFDAPLPELFGLVEPPLDVGCPPPFAPGELEPHAVAPIVVKTKPHKHRQCICSPSLSRFHGLSTARSNGHPTPTPILVAGSPDGWGVATKKPRCRVVRGRRAPFVEQ